ncbi:MAG: hypothetical protein JWQ11_4487 [Rhizobacter sp.]|jgi:hypothetical protein|nr:hypothetical protein [Rhizobacter sp.]
MQALERSVWVEEFVLHLKKRNVGVGAEQLRMIGHDLWVYAGTHAPHDAAQVLLEGGL